MSTLRNKLATVQHYERMLSDTQPEHDVQATREGMAASLPDQERKVGNAPANRSCKSCAACIGCAGREPCEQYSYEPGSDA